VKKIRITIPLVGVIAALLLLAILAFLAWSP